MLLCLISFSSFALTPEERDAEIQKWDEMKKGWIDGKNQWERDLAKKEKEYKDLKDKTDIDAKLREMHKEAKDIRKAAEKGVKKALSGNTKSAAIKAAKAAKVFADELQSQSELIDIVYNESENNEKLSALEKAMNDLQISINTANQAIELSSQRINELNAATTNIQLPQWVNKVLEKLAQAQQRRNDRHNDDRKNDQDKNKKGGG